MAKIDDAADQLIGFAEKLRPLTDVADALKQIGSLEQAIVERKAQLKEAVWEHEDKAKELTAVREALEQANESHKATLALNQKQSDDILNIARAKAADIILVAQAQVEAIAVTAKEANIKSQQTHDAFIAEKKATLDGVCREIDDARDRLGAIQGEYDRTVARTEALKAAAKSVIGG